MLTGIVSPQGRYKGMALAPTESAFLFLSTVPSSLINRSYYITTVERETMLSFFLLLGLAATNVANAGPLAERAAPDCTEGQYNSPNGCGWATRCNTVFASTTPLGVAPLVSSLNKCIEASQNVSQNGSVALAVTYSHGDKQCFFYSAYTGSKHQKGSSSAYIDAC